MDRLDRAKPKESDKELDKAITLLSTLHRRAVTEQQHGRVGVELVYSAGRVTLIEQQQRFTAKP